MSTFKRRRARFVCCANKPTVQIDAFKHKQTCVRMPSNSPTHTHAFKCDVIKVSLMLVWLFDSRFR